MTLLSKQALPPPLLHPVAVPGALWSHQEDPAARRQALQLSHRILVLLTGSPTGPVLWEAGRESSRSAPQCSILGGASLGCAPLCTCQPPEGRRTMLVNLADEAGC